MLTHVSSHTDTHRQADKQTCTHAYTITLTQVLQQVFAVVGGHVVDSPVALVPFLNVQLTVATQHLQTVLRGRQTSHKGPTFCERVCVRMFVNASLRMCTYTLEYMRMCVYVCI